MSELLNFLMRFSKNGNKKVGRGVRVLKYSVVYGSEIGNNVLIGNQCTVSNAVIGSNVIIGNGCNLCKGVTVEDEVFIGDNVTFTNDKKPSIKKCLFSLTESSYEAEKTTVKKGATIGSGSIILPVTIGRYALIGAGSVVTHNVPDGEVWAGNPAKRLKT